MRRRAKSVSGQRRRFVLLACRSASPQTANLIGRFPDIRRIMSALRGRSAQRDPGDGVLGSLILECLCGQEMTIHDWVFLRARPNRWGAGVTPQGAGWLLRGTLGALIEWYRQYDRCQ
jgi:hypothetical protein